MFLITMAPESGSSNQPPPMWAVEASLQAEAAVATIEFHPRFNISLEAVVLLRQEDTLTSGGHNVWYLIAKLRSSCHWGAAQTTTLHCSSSPGNGLASPMQGNPSQSG